MGKKKRFPFENQIDKITKSMGKINTKKAIDDMFNAHQSNHAKSDHITPIQYSINNGLNPAQHKIIKHVSNFRSKKDIKDLIIAKNAIEDFIKAELNGGIPWKRY